MKYFISLLLVLLSMMLVVCANQMRNSTDEGSTLNNSASSEDLSTVDSTVYETETEENTKQPYETDEHGYRIDPLIEIEPQTFEYKTEDDKSTVSIHFPHNDTGMTIYSARKFYTDFTIKVTIPAGWTLEDSDDAWMCFGAINVKNSNGVIVGHIGFDKYVDDGEDISDEELNTLGLIYSQIDLATHLRYLVLPNDAGEDAGESPYEVIKTFEYGNVAMTKVYYSAMSSELDGAVDTEAKYNHGILTYNTAHRTYVAFEFDSDLTDENTVRDIAESIVWIK